MKTTVDCITPRTGYTACQRLKIIAPLIVLVIGCYYDGIASSLSGSDSREVEANSLPAHAEVGSPVQVDFPVRGSVTDAAGNTVFGVSIIEKGTSNGTTSAGDGSFTLNVTDARAVLVFSRVGFASLELVVTANMFVKLTAADSNMDEVVVVGYGTQRRRNVSSAISTLKIENTPLVNLPNPNFLDLLKGRITGLNIGAVANAGGNPSRTVRGQSSISASTDPLIVMDGVIFNGSFNEINPNDVESVDVLKDAAATAIYGSQGNAGVIIITTKKGKSGKPVINGRIAAGIQTPTMARPDMREGERFLQYRRDYMRLQNNKTDIPLDQLLLPKELQAYNEGKTVDWWAEVVKPEVFKEYQLNVSGGSDRFNYYVSGGYLDQQGVVYNDQFKRFTVLSKLDAKVTDWLRFGLNLSVVSKNADGVAADLERGTYNGPYGYMYSTFEGFGSWLERYPQSSTTTYNPLWRTLTYDEDRNQNYRSTAFAKVDVPWIKGLSYTFNYALNRWEGHGAQFNNERNFVNTLVQADLQDQTKYLPDANGWRSNSERTDWYLNHLINYKTRFLQKHDLDITLVAERQEERNRSMRLDARDFSLAGTTVLGINSLELGDPTKRTVNTGESRVAKLAYLARLSYVFDNRIDFSASIREDGYSGFAEGNKYGVFPAASIGYTISNESFFKNNFANFLKLRLSYGEIGNPSIGVYSTFPNIGTSNYLFGNVPVVTAFVSNLANKEVGWERTATLNLGLDFGILKNTLSGSVNLYRANTYDLLLNRVIPSTTGFTNVAGNIGKLANKGLEVELTSKNIVSGDFSWESGLNFWINRNKIVSLYGLDANGDGREDDDIANSRFIGKSLGAVYNYVFDGIVQAGDTAFTRIYNDKPGDIKFMDLNGDGKLNAEDRSIIGYTKENYTASLSNTLRYKGFELYFMFFTIQGGGKNNWYIGSNTYALNPATWYPNVANWLDKEYWMPETPSNTIPKPNYVNKYGYNFIADRSFIRLQDVSFAYTFSGKLLGKTPLKAARMYLSAKNLATFTRWEGLDPETATPYASQNGFPVFRIINLGLNVTL
jgi:TonB-linked SusC/RagA family outer membrane protein